MGKRVAASNTKTSVDSSTQFTPPQTRTTIRKRKYQLAALATNSIGKSARLNASTANGSHHGTWHENDDEDSSSNEAPQRHQAHNKRVHNASLLVNSPTISGGGGNGEHNATTESPKPVYTLRPSVVNGTILYDLTRKPWRLGRPIGKGNFGEIFLASDNITIPVTNENAKFVVKIEPHSNGPLFVEIHCLMNTAKKKPDTTCSPRQRHRVHSDHHDIEDDNADDDDDEDDDEEEEEDDDSNRESIDAALVPQIPPSGIPDYIASGSHYFGDVRYRFLVLPRFDRDLHSLIKNCRVHQKSVLTLAIQIINVLENLHDKGYCHNDVKAQNLMISKCKYYKRKLTTTTTTTTIGNGSKTKANVMHKKKYDDHYEEKLPTTDSGNSSEQETNDDNAYDTDFVIKRNAYRHRAGDDDDEEEEDEDDDDDEDFDDGATSNSNNSNSRDEYKTPINRKRKGRPRKNLVEFSGSNPVRSCRRQKRNLIYEEMVSSHYLRPAKRVSYSEFFYEDGMSVKDDSQDTNFSSGDELESIALRRTISNATRKKASNAGSARLARHQTRRQERLGERQKRNNVATAAATTTTTTVVPELIAIEEERIFLIDFGLASKFRDNGIHRPFVMDQRRAHDGTLEFTSRDAHMGAHSRRSDLECLGYNLLYWSQGYLPWKDAAQQHQQEKVHRAKEYLMTDVRELLKQIYGKQIPKYLGEFLHQVGQLAYHERPDYARYRRIFEREFQQLGYALNELRMDSEEIARTSMRVKEEIENKNDVFDMSKSNHNAWSIMSNISVTTPFQERTLSNRVSPKNLRSKSDKKTLKKKKFSWAEVLSQDPDQIARERAEKEFDREEELSDVQHPTIRRYEGKPTYAILEIQQRLRVSGRFIEEPNRDRENLKAAMPRQSDNNEDDDDDEEEASENDNDEQNENNDDEEMVEEDGEEDDGECMDISEESDEEDDDDQSEVAVQNNCGNADDDDEDELEKNDIDSETDASEVSSVHVRLRHCGAGRPRKDATRNDKQIKPKISSSKKSTTCKATSTTTVTSYDANINEAAAARKRKNKRATVAFTTKTRSSSANATSYTMERSSRKYSKTSKTTTTTNSTMRLYRGGVVENLGRGKMHAASAAGEIEQNKHNNYRRQEGEQQQQQQQHYNRHHHHKSDLKYCENISQQRNERGRVRTLERRTRRCLIKTDVDTEESNSNFSPDVRSLFNVWKKFNQH